MARYGRDDRRCVPILRAGLIVGTVRFPDIMSERIAAESDKLTDEALDSLGDWAGTYLDQGVSQIMIIGMLEVYKAALSSELMEDE